MARQPRVLVLVVTVVLLMLAALAVTTSRSRATSNPAVQASAPIVPAKSSPAATAPSSVKPTATTAKTTASVVPRAPSTVSVTKVTTPAKVQVTTPAKATKTQTKARTSPTQTVKPQVKTTTTPTLTVTPPVKATTTPTRTTTTRTKTPAASTPTAKTQVKVTKTPVQAAQTTTRTTTTRTKAPAASTPTTKTQVKVTKAPAQTARTPAKVTKSASTASRSVKGGTAAKPSTPTTASTAVKPATTATARRAAPLSPRKFVTIPTLPQGVKTYLVAGVTPIYTARGARVESFRSPTDTILLVQLDPGANVVRTLSLPRDTLLGSSGSRINSVLPRSGADALVRTVTAMTGVGIDAYVLVNLRGVRDLTDAAGGVTLTVGKAMNYDDFAGKLHIHFQPGRQTLGGQKAEEFLRFRHDARGDIGRIDRTRDFLQALTLRLLTPSGLERLPRVSAAVRANSRTTLSERDYQDILGFAMKRPKLQTFVLPGRNEGAYWRMDPGRAGGVLAAFRSPVQAKR